MRYFLYLELSFDSLVERLVLNETSQHIKSGGGLLLKESS
jgi:hypothetical protein